MLLVLACAWPVCGEGWRLCQQACIRQRDRGAETGSLLPQAFLQPGGRGAVAGRLCRKLAIDPETVDPRQGAFYRKRVFDKETMEPMGNLLEGSADDVFSLLGLPKQYGLVSKPSCGLFMRGVDGEPHVYELKYDAIVCVCDKKVTNKDIVDAVKAPYCCTVPDIRRVVTAGSECGGCVLNTGYTPQRLKTTLESCGETVPTGICVLFPFASPDLLQIILLEARTTWEAVVEGCARAGHTISEEYRVNIWSV